MANKASIVIAALLFGCASSQEMMTCFTCDDEKAKCDLDCVMPKERASIDYAWPSNKPEDDVTNSNCMSLCVEKRSKCVDSDEITACVSCVSDCASTLDSDMVECLQAHDTTTTAISYGVNLDACMSTATDAMDSCRVSCTGVPDNYGGWTPETEDGTDTTGDVTDIYKLRERFSDDRVKKEGTKAAHLTASSGLNDKMNKEHQRDKESDSSRRYIRA
jgi:hypothetical protein